MRVKTVPQVIKAIKEVDPLSAVNENMIMSLVASGVLPYQKRGNRTVVDLDAVISCLNQLLNLNSNAQVPHIRTIRGAMCDIKQKFLDLGIGEKQIRDAVENGQIDTIHIGNRAYVALEFFEEPHVSRIFSSDFDYIAPKKPNRAVEQIQEILAQGVESKKMIRIR